MEAKFVNLQDGLVTVPGPSGQTITVIPWSKRKSDDDPDCVLVGEHYQQFVGARGPLYPFPVSPAAKAVAPSPVAPRSPAPVTPEARVPDAAPASVPAATRHGQPRETPTEALVKMGFKPDFIETYKLQLESVSRTASVYLGRGMTVEEAEHQLHLDFGFETPDGETEPKPAPTTKGRLGRKR